MNLRHFLRQKQGGGDDGSSNDHADATYYMLRDGDGHTEAMDEKAGRDIVEITRIPSCAIFHKITAGQGVPHTFTGGRLEQAAPRFAFLTPYSAFIQASSANGPPFLAWLYVKAQYLHPPKLINSPDIPVTSYRTESPCSC